MVQLSLRSPTEGLEVFKAALGSSSFGRPENLYWDFFQPIGIEESENGQ